MMHQTFVDGLTRLDIGADHIKLHGMTVESRYIELVKLIGQHVIGKFGSEEVTRLEQRLHTAISPVVGVAFVVTNDTSRLPAFVVAAESGTCRYANESIKLNAILHHDIHHARRE